MRKVIPILLAVLLLSACGAQGTQPPADTQPPAAAEQTEEADSMPTETEKTTETAPVMSDTKVTLDGLDSYLRLTLPEGWTWTEGESGGDRKSLLLCPPTDDGFQVEACWWDAFGMCGTGVDFQELLLPNGMKATLATEGSAETVCWTLILPASPDQFTLQINAPQALIDAHQAEIDAILSGLQTGVLAHIPPQPTAPLADR